MENTNVSDCSLSAEIVTNNVDLLTVILLRVPAKSLVRLKCVSNDWYSLISETKFSNDHTRQNSNVLVALYTDSSPLINFNRESLKGEQSLPTLDFVSKSLGRQVTILHSCNGLMLCSGYGLVVVCNLTIQKFKFISSLSKRRIQIDDGCLSFYPSKSPQYKVVLVQSRGKSIDHFGMCNVASLDIDVYSSESGILKKVQFGGPFKFHPSIGKVLCNGAIYWISDRNNILRFDIDKEKLTPIQLSYDPVIHTENTILWFGEHSGHLFLIQTIIPDSSELQILEMDMPNTSWITRYAIDLGPFINTIPFTAIYNHYLRVLCFKEGDDDTPIPIIFIFGKILSYNLKTNCFEIPKVDDDRAKNIYRVWVSPHKFIESLAMV